MTDLSAREGTFAGQQPRRSFRLLALLTGHEPAVHEISGGDVSIGRDSANDIVIPAPWVSRFQARLSLSDGRYVLEPAPEATVALTFRGHRLLGPAPLASGDFFRVAGPGPGEMVTCFFLDAEEAEANAAELLLAEGAAISIGSDATNDLGAGSAVLLPRHARIERMNGSVRLTDFAGDVLVNGEPAGGQRGLASGDEVRVRGLRLTLTDAGISYADESAALLVERRRPRPFPDDFQLPGSGGVLVEALHLEKRVRSGANLLQDISLRIRPRELVVILGLSGAGKSTLLDALAGYRPATGGRVLVDGVDLYANFDAFRTGIGFVPQRDIIHMSLTVFEALEYAARLRMPPDATEADRRQRVEEVMADLGLTERRDVIVGSLSGGQQKRVSIGVELITRPELLFLDEPTSGLDPRTETSLMQLLRDLADQGRTVILITHATKNVMLADKVVFLVRGGRVAWFGPPREAVAYFDGFRSDLERLDRPLDFDEIYSLLEDAASGSAEEWAVRFRTSEAHLRYVAAPLRLGGPTANGALPRAGRAAPRPVQASGLRQLLVLSARNVRLLSRDRFALLLMLLAAPGLAALDFLITKRDMFDPLLGDTARIVTNTNTIIVNAMLVGALAQMREIIKDRDIYRRERLVNLRMAPYIMSKVWVALALAFWQALAWTGVRYLAVDMPGGFSDALIFYVTILLVTMTGMVLGLFASAVAPTEDSVALIVALIIIPQVLFSGAHLPVHQLGHLAANNTLIMPSRWAFEALVSQSGYGSDLARDECWSLSAERRLALSEAEKASCRCLGQGLFATCSFPGILAYAAAEDRLPPATPSERAVASAESRLAVDHLAYGRLYDAWIPGRWLALVVIIVVLIASVLGVQRVREVR